MLEDGVSCVLSVFAKAMTAPVMASEKLPFLGLPLNLHVASLGVYLGVYLFTGLDHWTGLLDWTTGLTYDPKWRKQKINLTLWLHRYEC